MRWLTDFRPSASDAAVGGESGGFGYWFELRSFIVGPSASLPQAAGYNPQATNLGFFDNNVAHSNKETGLSFYPPGYFPRGLATLRYCIWAMQVGTIQWVQLRQTLSESVIES